MTVSTILLIKQVANYNCKNILDFIYIQPIAWITAHHIEEGKRELNFSEFGTYSLKKSNHKLEEVEETVHQREMPIKSYLQLHPEADLTDNEKILLIMWSKDLRSNLLK